MQQIPPTPPRFGAVVFDLFGTLTVDYLTSEKVALHHELADALGVPAGAFSPAWDADESRRLAGACSTEESLRSVSATLGVTPSDDQVRSAIDARYRRLRPFFDTPASITATMRVIREHKGLPLALVSACTEEVPVLWKDSPLAPFFSSTIFSSEVKRMKPDPAIYRLASDGLGVSPDVCLYVGDGSFGELHGAEAAGMTAALLRRPVSGPEIVHRPGEREWSGETITAIPEVLRLLC